MRHLSNLGIGFSLVSGFLFLALVTEVCYLLWWKRRSGGGADVSYKRLLLELLRLFCLKRKLKNSSSSLNSAAFDPNGVSASMDEARLQRKDLLLKQIGGGDEESMEEELMRIHGLAGPPRFLFTIKEETREDLESDDGRSRDGRRSRKGSRGKSLSELFLSATDTPFLTPLSSPPVTPLDRFKRGGGFSNPLFESSNEDDFIRLWSSPPPKFKFLKDAEEKLRRKKMMDEEETAAPPPPPGGSGEDESSFVTIVIGRNRERGHHQFHSTSSQVIPLPSSPSRIKPVIHGKF